MTTTEIVAKNVRRLRRANGWSQADLATCTRSITRNVVASLETGRRQITIEDLVDLAEALNVEPSILLVPLEIEVQCRPQRAG